MPRILLGTSIFLLTLSLLFGFLNTSKVRNLRDDLTSAESERELAERAHLASERKLQANGENFATANEKISAAEAKAASAANDLSKARSEEASLQASLKTSENQIADLKAIVNSTAPPLPGAMENSAPNESSAQLADLKHQLEAAEAEKAVLADKMQAAQDRLASLEAQNRRRPSGPNPAGVHGKVLAVNEAYNFVVLSIGERQGLLNNAELFVMRQGSLIGKIRVSSVEPTTSIGDIITNSLPRGVEVQPGDIVVYAGSNNS
jgi:DNA repair exonuclease SbcCD ATPase subunit